MRNPGELSVIRTPLPVVTALIRCSRVLGLAMVPGQHICQIYIDDTTSTTRHTASPVGHLTREIDCDDVM